MSKKHEIEFTEPQYDFVYSEAQFPAFVAGYGSGKTFAGIYRVLKLKFDYPQNNVAYYLPTYDLIGLIAFPRFAEVLEEMKLAYVINKAERTINVLGASQIILRTMDQPERIVGYEVGDSVIDELDTLKQDKAAEVFRKIVARQRQHKPDGKPNTIGVATTPEGFRFVYENWHRTPMKGSALIKASTMSNIKNLPDGYIDQLKSAFPEQQLMAYLEGDFVNLTQGSVYHEFCREKNGCTTKPKKGETLHVGVDFNVGQMAGIVHVIRDNEPRAVDEFVGLLDTPALIAAIKRKYVDIDVPCKIMAYPDASGKNRKSQNASESDIAQLKAAGFTVLAKPSNPLVKNRISAMNLVICKRETDKNVLITEKRRYKVNIDKCPHLVEGLEKQAYDKNGDPDKTSGLDHAIDATGYFIAYRYPVQFGKKIITRIKGA